MMFRRMHPVFLAAAGFVATAAILGETHTHAPPVQIADSHAGARGGGGPLGRRSLLASPIATTLIASAAPARVSVDAASTNGGKGDMW